MSELGSELVCAGCGERPESPLAFRCPKAGGTDDVDHVLTRRLDLEGVRFPTPIEGVNPFLLFRELLHSYRLGKEEGVSDAQFVGLVDTLDRTIAHVDGTGGFVVTPYRRSETLAGDLGIGALWYKDETPSVAGSHKARHLMAPALLLLVAEHALSLGLSGRLAIASCGNAALAAATLARAMGRELEAFVPVDADAGILERLRELGSQVVVCERVAGDPAGDPCMRAFRRAVKDGAYPFTVQGSENALVIEGGETLGWELVGQHAALSTRPLDRVAIQVGGGALASSCVQAFREARTLGALDRMPRIHAVQTEGGHPLERAWRRLAGGIRERAIGRGVGAPAEDAADAVLAGWIAESGGDGIAEELSCAAHNRSSYMWPWEGRPASVATGILDDETYDWLAVAGAMIETGGWPVVVDDAGLLHARDRARALTGVEVDATGAAGLAGVYALARDRAFAPDEHVAVLFTGGAR